MMRINNRTGRVALVAANDSRVGSALCAALQEENWRVAGPFATTSEAVEWLTFDHAQFAILDTLLVDGSASRLATLLQREGVPFVFFAGFDTGRRMIRAEFPNEPGCCRESSLPDLLEAMKRLA
jgi:hypothetical protein